MISPVRFVPCRSVSQRTSRPAAATVQTINRRTAFWLLATFGVLAAARTACAADQAEGARVQAWHGYQSAIELRNEHTRVVLCPEVGGRVLEYALDGTNVLYLSEDERTWQPGQRPPASAGRFDIGPELVIPPHPTLWNGVWEATITGPRRARLSSQPDQATGVRLTRDFELDEHSSRLVCTQTMHNVSDTPREWCYWCRTFAVGRGICLIPLTSPSRFPGGYVMYEEGTVINVRPEDPAIRQRDGFLEILRAPRRPKLGFDSTAGLLAYAAPNNLLFIKRFTVDPDRVYNEAAGLTLSVWYPDREMVELEPIGPRERLAPGGSASFTEEWWLAPFEFPQPGEQLDLQQVRALTEQLGQTQ